MTLPRFVGASDDEVNEGERGDATGVGRISRLPCACDLGSKESLHSCSAESLVYIPSKSLGMERSS